MAIEQYNANQAIVLNSSIEKQPAVEQVATQVRNAWLTLQRTKIVSPVDAAFHAAVYKWVHKSPFNPINGHRSFQWYVD